MIEDYLKNENNSVFREKLINYKFFYEIKYSAAKARNDIKIYSPEVDRDGYDVLLDDGDRIVPFQLKTFFSTSKTSSWDIRKNLFRPLHYNCSSLGFEESPEGEGVEGGFILVEIKTKGNEIEDLIYYYTDCYILAAFESGLIRHKNSTYGNNIIQLQKKLKKGSRKEKVKVTSSCLLKVKSVDDILALTDLPSVKQTQWRTSFRNYYKNYLLDKLVTGEKEELIEILKGHLNDKEVKFS